MPTVIDVTDVWVRLPQHPTNNTFIAYASVVLDGVFKVRDLKVFRGANGQLKVSMPARQERVACVRCRHSCAWSARYCAACGQEQPSGRGKGRYLDLCHPVCPAQRAEIELAVLTEYCRVSNRNVATHLARDAGAVGEDYGCDDESRRAARA